MMHGPINIRVLYNMPKPRGDFEISSSFYVLLLKLSLVGRLLGPWTQ